MPSINFTPQGPWSFVKIPQFVEETSFGVPPAAPVFKAFGNLSTLNPGRTIDRLASRWVGPNARDVASNIKLGTTHTLELTYIPADITVMRYGTELPSGAGSNEKSITILVSVLLNGVEKYIEWLGCLTDRITCRISRDAGISVTQTLMPRDVVDYAASPAAPITTPTYAEAPSTEPWTGITSGPDPLTIAGTKYAVPEFTFEVGQNVIKTMVNGVDGFDYAAAGNRDVRFNFQTWAFDGTLLGITKNFTAETMSYVLAVAGGHTYTANFTNAKFDTYSISYAAGTNDLVRESFAGTAQKIQLTDTT